MYHCYNNEQVCTNIAPSITHLMQVQLNTSRQRLHCTEPNSLDNFSDYRYVSMQNSHCLQSPMFVKFQFKVGSH